MSQGEKRKWDQVEGSSVGASVLSSDELQALAKCARERPKFSHHRAANFTLLNDTKKAALKAAPSIVSLVSFSGPEIVSQACGTVIESVDNVHTVLTSLSLLRQPTKADVMENILAEKLKVIVYCSDEESHIGEIDAYDFHYNILIIKFKSASSLPIGNLEILDDMLKPGSLNMNPGDSVIVAGRYFFHPFDVMAAPGVIRNSKDCSWLSDYGCNELLSSTCNITRCGDGSPVINQAGKVLGIAYYQLGAASPILPLDIPYKWWSHFKTFRKSRNPSYGFIASDLYSSAPLSFLARFEKKFPKISYGLFVEKVQPKLNAELAGLRESDIITKCDGISVKSFVELWIMLWDKVGESVELEIARVDNNRHCNGSTLQISLAVGETTPEEWNKWPRHDFC